MKIPAYLHKVQYYETDCMQIVHHSNYIRFFEEARVDFLERLGVDYAAIERAGYVVPVLSVSAEYKGMTTFGDTLAICVKFEEFSGIRFSFSYQIYNTATGVATAMSWMYFLMVMAIIGIVAFIASRFVFYQKRN